MYSEFFWSISFRIQTKYGEILRILSIFCLNPEKYGPKNIEYGSFSTVNSIFHEKDSKMFKIQNKISAFLNYIGYHNWGRIVKDGFLNLISKPSQPFTSNKNLKTLLNRNRSNLLPNSYPGVYMLTFSFDTVFLREICPNTEFSLVCIFRKKLRIRKFPRSVYIMANGKRKYCHAPLKINKIDLKKK